MLTTDALQANPISGQSPQVTALLIELRRLLEKGFDEPELRDLCFHLGLDSDDVRGQTRNEKVRELTLFTWRTGLMSALLEYAREVRPNLAWPELKGDLLLASLSPEEKKAAMPIDSLADPGGLLPSSHVPRRNQRFVGREATLRHIATAFRASAEDGNRVVIISGIAGIGKTQLAVEFAHRYGRYFAGGVYWLNFGEEGNPESDIVKCGRKMLLHPDFGKLELADQLALVQRTWQAPTPRLVIFDDCRTEALLRHWLPQFGGTQVLVTSWKSNWLVKVEMVPIQELTVPESSQLLGKIAPELKRETAAYLAEELGHFPLALWMAGSFLRNQTGFVDPQEYLQELQELGPIRHSSLREGPQQESPTGHQMDVGRTFILSYRQIKNDKHDRLAISLLQRAAYFAPDEPIPWRLLAATLRGDNERQSDPPPPADVAQALRRLEDLGLIRLTTGGNPLLHRLVCHSVIQAADAEQTAAAARAAVERTIAAKAQRINDEDMRAELVVWQGHLRYIAESAEKRASENAGWLLYELGEHFHALGDYKAARKACEKAMKIDEQVFDPDHQNVARDLNGLGLALLDQGHYTQAKQALERALAINMRVYGPNHHVVAEDTNALGRVLLISGEYVAARDAFERALAIDEAAYGLQHPYVAIRVNNVGTVLREQGDYEAAREAFERALAIDEAAHGPEHPYVAIRVNNLGSIHYKLGDYVAAKEAFQRALSVNEQVYGPEHPKVAIRLNNLGMTLNQLGNYVNAKNALERGLAINERIYGPNHPTVAILLNNLGRILLSLGDYYAAKEAFERALAIDEQAYDGKHPVLAKGICNLGRALLALGNYTAAKDAFDRALAIDKTFYGPEHSTVAEDINSLGMAQQALGRYTEARSNFEQALAIGEPIFGSEHPKMAIWLGNLGCSLRELGDYEGAQAALQRSLEIDETVFGPDHPRVARDLENLGELYRDAGAYAEARGAFQRTLEIRENVLGPDHPRTVLARKNLEELDALNE